MFSSAMLAAEDPIDAKSERNIVSTMFIVEYMYDKCVIVDYSVPNLSDTSTIV